MKLKTCSYWQTGIHYHTLGPPRWGHQGGCWWLCWCWLCRKLRNTWRPGEMNQLFSPMALCGRLLISPTCTTCSSEKHEAEVCFDQHFHNVSMMVRPWWCWQKCAGMVYIRYDIGTAHRSLCLPVGLYKQKKNLFTLSSSKTSSTFNVLIFFLIV